MVRAFGALGLEPKDRSFRPLVGGAVFLDSLSSPTPILGFRV